MSDTKRTPEEHDRFPYSAIVDRPKLRWPNGARIAVWVVPNLEHYLFDRPGIPLAQATTGLTPDVLNYAWRDYGMRVGIWRTIEALERHGFKATAALNSQVCERYPRIIDAGKESRLGVDGPRREQLDGPEQARSRRRARFHPADRRGDSPKGRGASRVDGSAPRSRSRTTRSTFSPRAASTTSPIGRTTSSPTRCA